MFSTMSGTSDRLARDLPLFHAIAMLKRGYLGNVATANLVMSISSASLVNKRIEVLGI